MIDTTFMNSAQGVYQTEICMHVYTSTNWYRILLSKFLSILILFQKCVYRLMNKFSRS